MSRAYSVLHIKSVDADARVIKGIATTPSTDRVGDTIDPLGAKFADDIPLMWQHTHGKTVGRARLGKPTKDGIPFEATIHREDEPGLLKDLTDLAWQSVRAGLVRGVSIGFGAKKYAFLKEGGIAFEEIDIHELSLVDVPANADATIHSVKSIDAAYRSAAGLTDDDADRPTPASRGTVVKSTPTRQTMKTIGEQIAAFEATKAARVAAQLKLTEKSGEAGVTFDANEQAEFDANQAEIDAVDGHIERLKKMEKAQASTARPAAQYQAPVQSTTQPTEIRVATAKSKQPGQRFAQSVRCLVAAKAFNVDAARIAEDMYGDDQGVVNLVKAASIGLFTKAAVAAANTLNDTWAGALVSEEGGAAADFVEFLRPQTIVGRIPNLRRVPFRTPLIGQTSGGAGYWVGEGKPKPLTKFDFNRTTLLPLKVANIAVATKELLRDSSPSADLLIRDSLAAALRERIDLDFIDPAKAAVANVSPASILNGVTGIPSSGTDADAVRCDVQALFAAFIAANNPPSSGVWIMPTVTAMALGMMQNPLGQSEFPGVGMNGGTFQGMPVVVSDYVPYDTAGAVVALVNASDIWFADDGGISIDMSTEASLQMDNAPTNASVSGAGNDTVVATSMVSMFQTNSVAFLAERTLNWARRRESAVAYLTGVNWGACPAP